MLEEIIKAISIKLNTVFGDEYEIYSDNILQGLREPCFFIALLQPERQPIMGSRDFQSNPFDLHYFPKNDSDNMEMIVVGEKMMDAMEYVTLLNGDMVRGTGRKYEIVDGVLHFFVNYNMHLIKPVEETSMEDVYVDAGVKRG